MTRNFFRPHRFVALFLLLPACGLLTRSCLPAPLDDAAFEALYREPLPTVSRPLRVYHLGHSLVGKDMPFMVQQLGGAGHAFHSQLGWGANLNEHWEPDIEVKGFAESNTHAQYRDPHQSLSEGSYDALVVTEAVEIKSAIKYSDPAYYLMKWATAAWAGNPDMRVYFYETWHSLDTEEGWLFRLDRDLDLYWEGEILRRALAYDAVERPIYMIPGGQVMAAATRAAQAGALPGLSDADAFFKDDIHFNDIGAYLIALTHFAVLYGQSPVGLPHVLEKADGTLMTEWDVNAAIQLQEIVWQVVTGYPPTGVPQR